MQPSVTTLLQFQGKQLTEEEEEEEFYKLLPANKADHFCQSWQSCSDLHKIQTVYDIVDNPHHCQNP